MGNPVFRREGDAFLPTEVAASPWSDQALHGGPPAALLAYTIERHVDDPAMQVVRLTFDLFRVVPRQPLHVHAESVRGGRRVHVVQASLLAGDVEVSRATALLLRRTEGVEQTTPDQPSPPGPEGFETLTGIARRRDDAPGADRGLPVFRARYPGFHTNVETRWVSAYGAEMPPTVWIRVPMPVIEGEPTTPIMRAAALSDFGNALGNQALGVSGDRLSYINADITMYFHRDPVGEWLCLQGDHRQETDGAGFVESIWFDVEGRYARGVQSRLLNPRD